MSRISLAHPLGAVATLALAASLSACGGGGDGGGDGGGGGGGASAPDDASVEEFCGAYNSIFDDLMGNLDPNASEEESGKQVVEAMKSWEKNLDEAGTPQDMPDEARDGFELLIKTAEDINADDFKSADDLDNLEKDFSDDEKAASTALTDYTEKTCESPFDLPSDLPTADLPELPSDLPTDALSGLPSDFPTELLTELPTE